MTPFQAFCHQASDTMLQGILEKEWEAAKGNPARKTDYRDAELEAARRGWFVRGGERVG